MAFPVVQEAIESSTPTAGTSHIVTLPTATAGQLLIIIIDIGSTAATWNALADLTELLDEGVANGLYIAYRWMDGTEPASYTLTSSASTRSAHIAYRLSGTENPATQAPQIATTATGTSATPDPPASATPGSTKDFLFIAFYGAAGEEADDDTWSDTPPTSYTPSPPRQKACGVAGTNLGGMIAAAERALNTGLAQNPGTFAKDVSVAWRAQTIMVHPVSVQTFNQTLTATAVASTATRTLQANKPVTASIVSAIATMSRGLTFGRTLTADLVAHVASMARALTFGRALTATAVSSTATRTLEVAKGVTATAVSSAVTMVRNISKAMAAAVSSTATVSVPFILSRTLAAAVVSTTATIDRGLSLGRTLTASIVTTAATMSRALAFGRTLNAVVTSISQIFSFRSQGLPFLYTSANWGTVSIYLEVWMRASIGTARARLHDDTLGQSVAGSELTTTSATYVRLRSSALTLVNGRTYSVQFGRDETSSVGFKGAKLIII